MPPVRPGIRRTGGVNTITEGLYETMPLPAHPHPKPPAQVTAYVDALGLELTVRFLLRFGGAELYIPDNPQGRSQLANLIGVDNVRALAEHTHLMQRRVPLANAWIAAFLSWQGMPISETARTIRATDVTVRGYLDRYGMRDVA